MQGFSLNRLRVSANTFAGNFWDTKILGLSSMSYIYSYSKGSGGHKEKKISADWLKPQRWNS